MQIIALLNHKGGVGKTTTTLNLGAALTKKGFRVLLVDLDGQANLTVCVGANEGSYTIYDSFRNTTKKIPIQTTNIGMDIVPASLDLLALESELVSEPARELLLKEMINDIEDKYDFVLIDCPPALGILTFNALTAAKYIIIPVEAEALALRGMTKLLEVIRKVQMRLNPALEILGILVTKYDRRKILNRRVHETIRKNYETKIFSTIIRDNVALAEAPTQQKDVIKYAPKSNGASDYFSLAEEILRMIHN